MFRFFILGVFCLYSVVISAQDTVNITDSRGRRQGYWRKADSAGKVIYEGRFRDGAPAGEFRYYYPDGKVKTISRMTDRGKRAETVSFFPNGNKMAAGRYVDEKKDSLWQFFSESNGTVVSEEIYRAGIVDGRSKVFYPDGGLSELHDYKNGVKNGAWEQYYLDGKLKLRGSYLDGEKSGPFKTFYDSGLPMISGQYTLGRQDGQWIYFDEKGEVSKKEVYDQGKLLKVETNAR